MIKHPGLRVASFADVYPSVVSAILSDLQEFARATPFPNLVSDFEVIGSYARGVASLHSDLDVNLATGTNLRLAGARVLVAEYPEAFSEARRFLHRLWWKWGLRIECHFEAASMTAVLPKISYSLVNGVWSGSDTRFIDVAPNGTISVRNKSNAAKLSMAIQLPDKSGFRPMDPAIDDPWIGLLPLWRSRYGLKLLEYGQTPDTSDVAA